MGEYPFLKGHGTENDFVLLPDHDGTIHGDLSPDAADGCVPSATAAPASAPTECCASCVRATDGSWTTATPTGRSPRCAGTASECSCGTSSRRAWSSQSGPIDIATRDGIKTLLLEGELVTVDLGVGRLLPETKVTIGATSFPAVHVDMGNPHAVVFVDDEATLAGLDLTHPPVHDEAVYPDGVNVEMVVRRGERHVAMRVHERGSGETRSCGTGAGAVLVAVGDGRRGAPPGDVHGRRPRRHPGPHLDRGRPGAADRSRGGRGPRNHLALTGPRLRPMDFEGASAVVTGAASGIGAACARQLAAHGARVVVADLNAEKGEAVASEIGGMFVGVDVTNTAQIQQAVDQALEMGPLRALVNSAGIGWAQRTIGRDGEYDSAHDLEAFKRVVAINLVGTFDAVRIGATAMSRNEPDAAGERGAIVNVSSVAAFDGQIGQAAYAASKGGLVGLTLPVARDLAASGIRLNTVAPGLIDTPIYDFAPEPEEFKQQLGESVLFPRRLGTPDELAAMVLACLTNTYMNGETIRVDGGIRMPPK